MPSGGRCGPAVSPELSGSRVVRAHRSLKAPSLEGNAPARCFHQRPFPCQRLATTLSSMKLTDHEILRQLGTGTSIDDVCQTADISREEFHSWWRRQLESRCADPSGTQLTGVRAEVAIERDRCGIPHIFAENDSDLFFGFGYAMAQDRLFQLDYLRRKGLGRLAEILGPNAVESDRVARTVGLHLIATAEWKRLERRVQLLLEAFSAGVNAVIQHAGDLLPIEFGLLDYRPEPWSPVDCLAIESEFRWYLSGRIPVIALPELARKTLGEGALFEEYLLAEADDVSILQAGDYEPRQPENLPDASFEPVGHLMADPEEAIGSNNWVVSGRRTTTGLPLLASDPHIAFEAVSCWYPAHLRGGSFNTAGTCYVGIPAIMIGRNERMAWGITNNICMQRDLYQERTDEAHPDCFLYDDQWIAARERPESIAVRDQPAFEFTVRSSTNGPIVDKLLPIEAQPTGPVSLKWLGAYAGGWLTAMLDMDRANTVDEFRGALRPWHVPTFSLVFADLDGHIAYQTAGRIPVRDSLQRGYRPGWDPAHQWRGLISFEQMPRLTDPARGWIASANNRVAPDDYPHRLYGCWVSGWRAQRIAEYLEQPGPFSLDDMRRIQLDLKSLRAAELVPLLLQHMRQHDDPVVQAGAARLEEWDCVITADSVAATIFNVFFSNWCRLVAAERFPADEVELMSKGVEWCAGRILAEDPAGWFTAGDREQRIAEALSETFSHLTRRFGPDLQDWQWGKLHRMPRRHVLSEIGDLRLLLDCGPDPVGGDMLTVNNSGSGPDWTATTGAGYRMICDLSTQPPRLLLVDAQSQSGNAGSPHYDDQFAMWLAGDYIELSLDREVTAADDSSRFRLLPAAN